MSVDIFLSKAEKRTSLWDKDDQDYKNNVQKNVKSINYYYFT